MTIGNKIRPLITFCFLLIALAGFSQKKESDRIEQDFYNPPASARPWVFWYWMNGAVSKQGITADLEAMKQVGIGGAYLMPIKDTSAAIPFQPTVRQQSPAWWEMINFALQEAKRLGLQIAMHVSDGFALAGGPWITPELSMQKIVWTKTYLKEGKIKKIKLDQPETKEGYYKDIAVFAYPANCTEAYGPARIPTVTTSNGVNADFLAIRRNTKQSFRSDSDCWIQYEYASPFTAKSIRIHVGGTNYQALRLIVQSSNDGINFKTITRLSPPRHGWQDTDEDYSYALPATTARFFRFIYNKEGSEPGAEDLDAAKWKPLFKTEGIYLSDEPIINQYEAKNGSVWRIAAPAPAPAPALSFSPAPALKDIVDLSTKLDSEGNLDWSPPKGDWIIVRIGHTSTGHTNATGGAAKGLECDKFNPQAITLQFNNWFGKVFEKTDPGLAGDVLKVFHVDSWECGSQNWSPLFAAEFKKRRGYDLLPYLLVTTGTPIESAAFSEKVLHDLRQTIAELVKDIFYATLLKLAHEKNCLFSAESVAPTMVSDGLLHYSNTDLPMGEFWFKSPTHDKPNDMLDAISGAHIYGKNIIQAEAFTTLRMDWSETPGSLKMIGDRNFALGINKMVLHVFTHNPWMDKKPGMTLDGVGLYFQRDQTWFPQSKAWMEYLSRCQALLQLGKPVVDIAVFTGEEVPRRSVLPDRLINTLPGIFGKKKREAEKKRLANEGQPLRTIPDGVTHSANMADPEDWIDPLNGYAYDSFNPDALMMMSVKNGRVQLPGGASYKILVFPLDTPGRPVNQSMSVAVAKKLVQLVTEGATIIIDNHYLQGAGWKDRDDSIKILLKKLFAKDNKKGKVIAAPYTDSTFAKLGLEKDVDLELNDHKTAWAHRKMDGADIYFIANQDTIQKTIAFTVPATGFSAESFDPETGTIREIGGSDRNGKMRISEYIGAGGSMFFVFRKKFKDRRALAMDVGLSGVNFDSSWKIQFDTSYGGPAAEMRVDKLESWTGSANPAIRYYSGTAVYRNTFQVYKKNNNDSVTLNFASIHDIATVKVNGIDCGTLWNRGKTYLNITKAVQAGKNTIEVEVTNTWRNRLIGDEQQAGDRKITWTTAPFRLKEKPLLQAGLIGNVFITIYSY